MKRRTIDESYLNDRYHKILSDDITIAIFEYIVSENRVPLQQLVSHFGYEYNDIRSRLQDLSPLLVHKVIEDGESYYMPREIGDIESKIYRDVTGNDIGTLYET